MIDSDQPDYRHNFLAFMGDWVSFSVAGSFASASTVLPAFVGSLSDWPVLVGLISTIASGGWLLPQLIAASRIAHKPRKKPYIIIPSIVGRMAYGALPVLLFANGVRNPGLVLAVFFFGYALFTVADAVSYTAWFDIFSRAIPMRRRGHFIGAAQLISSLLGMGVGVLIDYLLGDRSPVTYPQNFAVLFALAIAFMAVSLVSTMQIREPVGVAAAPPGSMRGYAHRLSGVLRTDRDFRRIVVFRLLIGLVGVATPFFVVYATKEVGLGTGVAGVFLTAQLAGGLAASVGLGYLSERIGSRITTIVEAVLTPAAPALALILGFGASAHPAVFVMAYAGVFVLVGASLNSFSLGHMTYLMESVPVAERATYVGLANTISGLLVAMPLVAGWVVQVASYPFVFGLAAAFGVPAVVVSLRLRDPRRAAAAHVASAPSDAPRTATEPLP